MSLYVLISMSRNYKEINTQFEVFILMYDIATKTSTRIEYIVSTYLIKSEHF